MASTNCSEPLIRSKAEMRAKRLNLDKLVKGRKGKFAARSCRKASKAFAAHRRR